MTWVPRWLYEASCTLYCRGGLLRTLQTLDEEEDINKILDFFSYEHFYVIYCKVGSTRYQQCIDVRMSASAVAMDSSGAAMQFGSWIRITTSTSQRKICCAMAIIH